MPRQKVIRVLYLAGIIFVHEASLII